MVKLKKLTSEEIGRLRNLAAHQPCPTQHIDHKLKMKNWVTIDAVDNVTWFSDAACTKHARGGSVNGQRFVLYHPNGSINDFWRE